MQDGYAPRDGLHVTVMGARYAEEWTRRVHNVKPAVGLGWTPYRIVVRDGALAYRAFTTFDAFRAWLGKSHWLELGPTWRAPGMRHGKIIGSWEDYKRRASAHMQDA
jgi:hypothetical protein